MPQLSLGQMCTVVFFQEEVSLKGGVGEVLPVLLLPSCVPPGSRPGGTSSPNLVLPLNPLLPVYFL